MIYKFRLTILLENNMALQTSGQISINDLRTELGDTNQLGLGDSNARGLVGISSGRIDLQDFYGASNIPAWITTGGTNNPLPAIGASPPTNHALYAGIGNTTMTSNPGKCKNLFDNNTGTGTALGFNTPTPDNSSEYFARYVDPMGQNISLSHIASRMRHYKADYWGNSGPAVIYYIYAKAASSPVSSLSATSGWTTVNYIRQWGPGPVNSSTPAIGWTDGNLSWVSSTVHSATQGSSNTWNAVRLYHVAPFTFSTPHYFQVRALMTGTYGASDSISNATAHMVSFAFSPA